MPSSCWVTDGPVGESLKPWSAIDFFVDSRSIFLPPTHVRECSQLCFWTSLDDYNFNHWPAIGAQAAAHLLHHNPSPHHPDQVARGEGGERQSKRSVISATNFSPLAYSQFWSIVGGASVFKCVLVLVRLSDPDNDDVTRRALHKIVRNSWTSVGRIPFINIMIISSWSKVKSEEHIMPPARSLCHFQVRKKCRCTIFPDLQTSQWLIRNIFLSCTAFQLDF